MLNQKWNNDPVENLNRLANLTVCPNFIWNSVAMN